MSGIKVFAPLSIGLSQDFGIAGFASHLRALEITINPKEEAGLEWSPGWKHVPATTLQWTKQLTHIFLQEQEARSQQPGYTFKLQILESAEHIPAVSYLASLLWGIARLERWDFLKEEVLDFLSEHVNLLPSESMLHAGVVLRGGLQLLVQETPFHSMRLPLPNGCRFFTKAMDKRVGVLAAREQSQHLALLMRGLLLTNFKSLELLGHQLLRYKESADETQQVALQIGALFSGFADGGKWFYAFCGNTVVLEDLCAAMNLPKEETEALLADKPIGMREGCSVC